MQTSLNQQIEHALGSGPDQSIEVRVRGDAELPSCFAVTDLAVAALRSASVELASLTGGREITIDRRLAALWFDMTLRPDGWTPPAPWDRLAGVYRASDGWIRLHTNAPHHREAALRVLECAPETAAVAAAVARWRKSRLEDAILAEKGAAAAMHSMGEWAAHPQGQAVGREPLIAWREGASCPRHAGIADLKVLDLTRVLAGPVATRFLAGFGAQVLRLDPPWWSEPGLEPEVTLGKRRAGLDLTQRRDRNIFEDLLSQADILVHGYRPGALSGLGYGEDRLQSLAPHMIDVSLCAYGWSGPWADRRGFDSLVQMSCGLAEEGMRRSGADHPVPLPVQALDHATGYLMAAAVLRAVRVRNETGAILSARLSLARTAALLVSQGAHDFRGEAIDQATEDFETSMEMTSWGPGRRLRFPAQIDAKGPDWRHPAGRLRVDPPAW